MTPFKQPLPVPLLIDVLGHVCEPYGSGTYRAAPPTPASVRRISDELRVALPPLFVAVATACPAYGGWFASIGDDFQSHMHILALNRVFHGEGLPARYIMFNHGHDGDCDCWDMESPPDPSGEPAIVYCSVGDDGRSSRPPQPLPGSFRDYLEAFCRSHVSSIRRTGVRRRIKRLLAEHGDEATTPKQNGRLG